jgi:pimeloyl-ACP methyl ester carboxylesterase
MMYRPLKFYWDLVRLVKKETPAAKEHTMKFVSDTDEAIIANIGGETYVAFDGTDTPREWLENLLTFKAGQYDVAYGFMNAAKEFYANMSQFLDLANENVIVGYSRGGAIAQAFAILARKDGYKVRAISFGSPRVGGRGFCRIMRGVRHTRVIFKADPVPALPLPFRFRHYETDLVELKAPEGVRNPITIHRSYGSVL